MSSAQPSGISVPCVRASSILPTAAAAVAFDRSIINYCNVNNGDDDYGHGDDDDGDDENDHI